MKEMSISLKKFNKKSGLVSKGGSQEKLNLPLISKWSQIKLLSGLFIGRISPVPGLENTLIPFMLAISRQTGLLI